MAWKEADRIVMVPAQLRYTTADAQGAGLPVVPVDKELPTCRGALGYGVPELTGGAEYD